MAPGGCPLQHRDRLHLANICVPGKARVKGCCKQHPTYDLTGGSSLPQTHRNGIYHLIASSKKIIFPNVTVPLDVLINWISSVQGIAAHHVLPCFMISANSYSAVSGAAWHRSARSL